MPTYTVVAADLNRDRRTIIEIWRRNLSSTEKLEEKFDWHFLHNPYGEGRCWLLERNGQYVGASALGVRPLKVGDQVITTGTACDLCVDKAHRMLQPALLLQKAVISSVLDGIPLIYGLPNADGAAPIERVGYKRTGVVHRYAKVLRLSPYLQKHPQLSRFSGLLGGPADWMYAAWARMSQGGTRDGVTEVLPRFDSRFDELWERAKNEHPVIGVRDSKFLRWRYEQCPLQSYTTVGLLSADRSRLLAYLVLYVQDEQVMCADLLAESGAGTITPLLAAAAVHVQKMGAASMSIHCSVPASLLESLKRLGFQRRTAASIEAPRSERGRVLLAYAGSSRHHALTQPWYFTPGDEPYN